MGRSASSSARDFVLRLLLLGLASFFGLTVISPFVPWNRIVEVSSVKNSALRTAVPQVSNRTRDASTAPAPPFYPNLALNEYQTRHSASVLRDEVSLDDRKFAVAYWHCPDRAGNILHNFFNSILWAMITNRTVLWIYGDGGRKGFPPFEECSNSLQVADWIPSYDDFRHVLHFDPDDAIPVPITVETAFYDSVHRVVIFPQIPDVLRGNKKIARNEWHHHPMVRERRDYHEYIKALPATQQRLAGMLYYQKTDYLMGMLFRACFTLLSRDVSMKQRAAFSIALHSRHPVIADDGSFVQEEMECLEELVSMSRLVGVNESDSSQTNPANCSVYLISDRPRTLRLLSTHVQRLGCQALVAHHNHSATGGMMTQTEHGPYAGAGYLEDLAFASRARHALVGDASRSSFTLLVELVTYDRFIEAWRLGRKHIDDLRLCVLQSKPSRGYTYGPGTPNFVHHTRLKPLQPEAVVQSYRSVHGVHSLQHSSDSRYLRVKWSCDESSIQEFLNGFLFAILVNRTMIIEEARDDPFCVNVISLASWLPSPASLANVANVSLDTLEDEAAAPNAPKLPASSNLEAAVLIEAATSNASVLDFTGISSIGSLLDTSQNYHRLDPVVQDRLKLLTAEGTEFLYGMLFFGAFEFSSSVRSSGGGPVVPFSLLDLDDEDNEQGASQQMHAVAVDVRHWDDSLEHVETADCLASVVDAMPSTSVCQFFVLADESSQESTIRRFAKWVQESSSLRHCTVASPPLNKTSAGLAEAAAGTDDVERWYFAAKVAWMSSRIRWAYVGPTAVVSDARKSSESSSPLPLQLIQYQRRAEMWHQGRDPPVLPLDMFVCTWQA